MNNQNLLRGLFLLLFAILFVLGSFNYSLGTFGRAGPGMFPLIISGVLLLLSLALLLRSFFEKQVPLHIKPRNLLIILASLCGFAVISEFINMTLGIVFLVFFSGLGAVDYSVKRNLKISAGLLLVAVLFQKLLGLNLPL